MWPRISDTCAPVIGRFALRADSKSLQRNQRRRRGISVAPGVSPGITTQKESKPAFAGDRNYFSR